MLNRLIVAALVLAPLSAGCGGAPLPPEPVVAVAAPVRVGLPNLTLLRGGEKDKMFIIINGTKRPTHSKTVAALGLDPNSARELPPAEFAAIPLGRPMTNDFSITRLIPQEMTKMQNRTLIRTADSPTIYVIVLGQRHAIDDPTLFGVLGLDPNTAVAITPDQMGQIPEGPHW